MKIFVINQGSSSIKCSLYSFEKAPILQDHPIWKATLSWKNDLEDIHLQIQSQHGNLEKQIHSKTNLLTTVLDFLWKGETAVIKSLSEIGAIGHRIVHGGRYFQAITQITPDVKRKIEETSHLAPLHNRGELDNIEALEKLLPHTPQFAVFDTAFHHTLPQAAVVYPGPYAWYEEKIQRYGFHGTSFKYCLAKAADFIPIQSKIVICHLGSGASLAAINEGRCIDTTMGFTPLEGLMMDTRSGTIDPGILLYLIEKKGVAQLKKELYYESGLLGLSGTTSDMRDIEKGVLQKDERCTLAFEVYIHRLNALIGSMIASLQGIDALIFTAGIGENSPSVRAKVCEAFAFLGLQLDPQKNTEMSQNDREISASSSKVKVLTIHTRESIQIAIEVFFQISK